MTWCIGLMSGTSLDGIDGVLCDFGKEPWRAAAAVHVAMPPSLHDELLSLNVPGNDELHRAALAANALTLLYVEAVHRLLRETAIDARQVAAIGAHGQTVRHRPGAFDGVGYTLQLMNGALLADRCGIDVICDLRSADVCAGGQGAPLVPAFHAAAFARAGQDVAVVNVGGIANITLLAADGRVSGFDTGPGNMLMDGWIRRHRGLPFDSDGVWADSGQVQSDLLCEMLAEAFFARKPPKSTGRDLFNERWLDDLLSRHVGQVDPVDVMATLAELTARSISDAVLGEAARLAELDICGGGSRNKHLMQRLSALLPGTRVTTTAERGIEPDWVEAMAFAWFAHCHLTGRPANLPDVTGARGSRVLGARYPAARACKTDSD